MATQRDDRTEHLTEQLAELHDALHRATRRAELAEHDLDQLNDRRLAGSNVLNLFLIRLLHPSHF
jgi:hypothetical protein